MEIVNRKNYQAHQRRRELRAWHYARIFLWHAPWVWLFLRVYHPTGLPILNNF